MKPSKPPAGSQNTGKKKPEAFDLWLKRGLHQIYDDVTNEPIPDDLLKLIEEDRKK
jgi:hypothetical protein